MFPYRSPIEPLYVSSFFLSSSSQGVRKIYKNTFRVSGNVTCRKSADTHDAPPILAHPLLQIRSIVPTRNGYGCIHTRLCFTVQRCRQWCNYELPFRRIQFVELSLLKRASGKLCIRTLLCFTVQQCCGHESALMK